VFGVPLPRGFVVHDDHVSDSSPVPKQPMPTPTRIAVILLALLGVLLLANALVTWLSQETLIDQIEKTGVDRDAAAQSVLLFLIAYIIIGLSALLASIFLPRRRNWARQVGILTTSLLVVMSVIATASGAGISIVGLLVPISAIVGLICLMSQQTKAWLHGVVRTD
jgi:hypothetical protein